MVMGLEIRDAISEEFSFEKEKAVAKNTPKDFNGK